MRVTLKLFALLARHLPPGAVNNQIDLAVEEGATPGTVIDSVNLPRAHCHLVLVNGLFVPPGEIDTLSLKDGDALAIWPPVAGG